VAFGGFDRGGESRPMAEINMIPLIDVMLVLLVIFIITAPLLTHAVKLDLPKAESQMNQTRPEHVALSITADGRMHWNGEPVERGELRSRLAAAAARAPQPELHVHADGAVAYRFVAQALADASRAGLSRIGFVSDPREQ
jgi:biopolymer transport protein ExbD